MIVKLKKVSGKSFILIFSMINVVSGFILGAVVTVVSLTTPATVQPAGATGSADMGGAWAILLFPILNGILGLVMGSTLIAMYNFFANWFGGVELELETL